jgi:murein L,D-transpeptidase YcbB/YkuD
MTDEFDHREPGNNNLFTKTLLILYTGLLAFTSGKVHATASATAGALPVDEDFVSRLRRLKYKPQLVLKLNLANPLATKAVLHTSHSSHSSHSSHYSSSSSGHSSHSSHSSHYSSSSYTPSSGSSSTPSYSTPSYSTPSYVRPSASATRRRSVAKKSSTVYPQSVSAVYALGDRVLKLGDRGLDVTALQQLLISVNYEITASGVFGLATNAAVKDFQAAHGLPADGVVGAQTLSALER